MIGEIRDKETMQAALLHTLTGHLCLSTIHANNSYHALSRIINLFPYEARSAVLSDLSIGLRAIVSQRLIKNRDGELQPAVEILLNTALIAELIKNGEFAQIKEAMEQSLYPGSQTFEQALCRMYLDGALTYDEAMIAADSPTNLAWLINQNNPDSRVDSMESTDGQAAKRPEADFASMSDRRRHARARLAGTTAHAGRQPPDQDVDHVPALRRRTSVRLQRSASEACPDALQVRAQRAPRRSPAGPRAFGSTRRAAERD